MLTVTDRHFIFNAVIDWATRDSGIVEHIRHYAETRYVDEDLLWAAMEAGILHEDYIRDVYFLTFREAGWGALLYGAMRNMTDAELVVHAITLEAIGGEVAAAFLRAVNLPVPDQWGHCAIDVMPLQYYTDPATYYVRNTPI
jgi:hypothetical protein